VDSLIIRTYRSLDFSEVMKLHKEALVHANAYTGEGPWDDDLLDIENHYLLNRGWFAIGEFNDQLVAMGAIRKIDDQIAEIKRMRTLPDLQGKGIGKKMLDALIDKAKQLGYSEIILETSDRQLAARKIYTSNGFIPFKIEQIRGLNCTWYKKMI